MQAAVGSRVGEPSPAVDLWAPVPFDGLPSSLLQAAGRSDWKIVREELRKLMDGLTTDGVYGRALLQFVMSLPLPSDPVLARYRGAICIDHGDWDGLLRQLGSNPIEAAELIGIRDIILASTDRTEPPQTDVQHRRFLFEIYEFVFQRAVRRYKRWGRRILGFYAEVVWTRRDVPLGRHFRFRRLQDGVWLAIAESHGGMLAIAEACADEAQWLGDEGEPGRDVAHDLKTLIGYARGGQLDRDLRLRARISSPAGLSPLGSWETLFHVVPFYTYLPDDSLRWTARVGQQIANRLASPRAQLQARSWHVAAGLLEGLSADGGASGLARGIARCCARTSRRSVPATRDCEPSSRGSESGRDRRSASRKRLGSGQRSHLARRHRSTARHSPMAAPTPRDDRVAPTDPCSGNGCGRRGTGPCGSRQARRLDSGSCGPRRQSQRHR